MELSDELLLTLKRGYGLKENHIFILKVLKSKDLNADEICDKTKIPKGRIYEFLNYLIHTRLIIKQLGSPAKYSIENLNQKLVDFAENQLNKELEKRSKLISLIDRDKTKSEFKVFTDPEESKIETRKAWGESKEIKLILRGSYLPYLFLLSKDMDAIYYKVIKIANNYNLFLHRLTKKDVIKKLEYLKPVLDKQIKWVYILDESSVENMLLILKKELSTKEFKEYIINIKKQLLENKNIIIRSIVEPSEYNIRICDDRKVHIMLRKYVYLTIATENREVINAYVKLFNKMYAKSKPFEELLKKFN
jgi:hypothetical protein